MTNAWAIKGPDGKLIAIGETEIYAWASVSSQYTSHEGLAAKGYTCVPVTVSEKGEEDLLPVHVADALIHQVKSGESFDKSVMLIALGQLRAYLSRGQG